MKRVELCFLRVCMYHRVPLSFSAIFSRRICKQENVYKIRPYKFSACLFLQFIIRPRHPQLRTRQDQLPYKSFRPHFIFSALFMPYFYIAFWRVAILRD